MRPLLIMTTYNRKNETIQTVLSLIETRAAEQSRVVIFDNGSTDGTQDYLFDLVKSRRLGDGEVVLSEQNIGCPRALNKVMLKHRKPGQAMIKVDNDVALLTPGWVDKFVDFVERHPRIALLSPWYHGVDRDRSSVGRGDYLEVYPLVGHTVYHSGKFLDETGFFDVLAPDHLYGFEDLLMCYRAVARGYICAVHKSVFLTNIQRHNSLDVGRKLGVASEGREDHVARLRPLYNERRQMIEIMSHPMAAGKYPLGYVVDRDGQVMTEQVGG